MRGQQFVAKDTVVDRTGATHVRMDRRYRGLPDLLRAMWAAVEENLGYRQLNAFWRLGGLVEALRGTRHDWGEMTRKGFDQEA